MKEGDRFPPVILFRHEGDYYLTDGFHRIAAAKRIDRRDIEALVCKSRGVAIAQSIRENTTHGLSLTREDKRRAIKLAVHEFPNLSSREIAKMCGVDHKTVEAVRGVYPPTRRLGADGKTRRPKAVTDERGTPVPEALLRRWKNYKKRQDGAYACLTTVEGRLKAIKNLGDPI
jgi:hypothetical protein